MLNCDQFRRLAESQHPSWSLVLLRLTLHER